MGDSDPGLAAQEAREQDGPFDEVRVVTHPPHHLTRWTPRALHTVLRRHGLQVHEHHTEPMRTVRQAHSAWCDLLWEVWRQVAPRMGLGWALQPVPRSRHARVAFLLRTLALKIITGLATGPAVAMYPLVRRGAYQGKSLVLIASV